jgi:hypothetical protein
MLWNIVATGRVRELNKKARQQNMKKISNKTPSTITFDLRDSENGFDSSFQKIGEPVTGLIGEVVEKELLLLKAEEMKFFFHMGSFLPALVPKKVSSACLRILNADAKSMNIEALPMIRQCNGKEKNVVPTREPGKADKVTCHIAAKGLICSITLIRTLPEPLKKDSGVMIR